LRTLFCEYFGVDFSDVRVHTDGASDRLAQSVGARGFTALDQVFLRDGEGDPETRAGLWLLCHEATHIAQQRTGACGGRAYGGALSVGRAGGPEERTADACADELVVLAEGSGAGTERNGRAAVARLRAPGATRRAGVLVQRAIGLEIEIPVPIDQLNPAQVTEIRDKTWSEITAGVAAKTTIRQAAVGLRDMLGSVPYSILRAPAGGFRVDADHDDRVTTPNPATSGWPIRQGSRDSIMEIVMVPPAVTQADLTTSLDNITAFVNLIDANTHGLTTRWLHAFPAPPPTPALPAPRPPVSVGPIDYTHNNVHPAVRLPHHNYQGSIQVNVGIDLREYHSLLHWYADSPYAVAARDPDPAAQAIYRQIKDHIRQAVDIGRDMTNHVYNAATAAQRQQAGNFRGLRGWLTHLALYLLRGTIAAGTAGGTAKNLVPVLIKSPNQIMTTYGMTVAERNHFVVNQVALMNLLFTATGRAADAGQALGTVHVFAAKPGLTADILSDVAGVGVALAGGPILTPTGVGPTRTGNADVAALPNVGAGDTGGGPNRRGGLVAEFRTLPGYYDGPVQWRALAQAFFDAAEERNSRDGIQPD
jgi:hypothetical protein